MSHGPDSILIDELILRNTLPNQCNLLHLLIMNNVNITLKRVLNEYICHGKLKHNIIYQH